MEQDITLEIVGALMGGGFHARALAKRLGTNHVTVARKLKALVSENAVDFRVEGKNKSYFLKRSAEARGFVLMAEAYKLNGTIGKYPELRGIIEKIQKNPKISLALLFGSYSKGTAGKDSDMDVFIETKGRGLKKEIEFVNSRLSVKIGKYDSTSDLAHEIEKNHVIIKGAEIYHEKTKLFQPAQR